MPLMEASGEHKERVCAAAPRSSEVMSASNVLPSGVTKGGVPILLDYA